MPSWATVALLVTVSLTCKGQACSHRCFGHKLGCCFSPLCHQEVQTTWYTWYSQQIYCPAKGTIVERLKKFRLAVIPSPAYSLPNGVRLFDLKTPRPSLAQLSFQPVLCLPWLIAGIQRHVRYGIQGNSGHWPRQWQLLFLYFLSLSRSHLPPFSQQVRKPGHSMLAETPRMTQEPPGTNIGSWGIPNDLA